MISAPQGDGSLKYSRNLPSILMTSIATLAAFVGTAACAPAWAGENGRFIVDEENDTYGSSDDRHFTQGMRASYVTGDIAPDSLWSQPFNVLAPVFGSDGKRKAEVIFGQSIFTPANLRLANPDPKDHPYAGWLYGGVSLMQERDGAGLENLELLAGVVGPSALGKQVQNDFHDLIQVGEAHGWSHQLHDEPGVVLTYERKWRFEQPLLGGLAIDVIPETGASLGNVFTYAAAGGTVRFGHNLKGDYGPTHIRPSLSGSGWFDADRLDGLPFGWSVFAGTQGRAVARNIFLDGNTVRDSAHVDKKPLVGDLVWGVSAFWSDALRVDFSVTERSKEFYGQVSRDRIGMIDASFSW
jgi:hypothetical protein